MSTECKYCNPLADRVVLDLPDARLLFPDQPHVSPADGGHLVVAPRRHLAERRHLSPAELLTVDLLAMIGADALSDVLGTDWQNYQENGNWQDEPRSGHMHLHVYGRRRGAVEQAFGEALRFPARRELDVWEVASPTDRQRAEIRAHASDRRRGYPAIQAAIQAAGADGLGRQMR